MHSQRHARKKLVTFSHPSFKLKVPKFLPLSSLLATTQDITIRFIIIIIVFFPAQRNSTLFPLPNLPLYFYHPANVKAVSSPGLPVGNHHASRSNDERQLCTLVLRPLLPLQGLYLFLGN